MKRRLRTLLASYLLTNTPLGFTRLIAIGSSLQPEEVRSGQLVAKTDPAADDPSKLLALETGIRAERYAGIEDSLRAYVAEHPNSWRAHYDLGYVLFRRHDGSASLLAEIQESIKELSRSLELNVTNAEAHKILALDLSMVQRDDLAEVELKQAVRLDPSSAESHYFLGRHYMGQSRYALAKEQLEAAARLDPTSMKTHENLGITLDRMRDAPDALIEYKRAIELDRKQEHESELPYLDLAKFYQEQNSSNLALEYAQKALAINTRSDDAFYESALIYRELKEWDAAVEALSQAIALNPREAQYYFLLGRTYATLGRKKESEEAFRRYMRYRDAEAVGMRVAPLSTGSEKGMK